MAHPQPRAILALEDATRTWRCENCGQAIGTVVCSCCHIEGADVTIRGDRLWVRCPHCGNLNLWRLEKH